jgi:hypothetical protein
MVMTNFNERNMKKGIYYIIFICLSAFLSASLISCTEEKNEIVREKNVDIETLGVSLNELKEVRDNSIYGIIKGNYPEESKEILNTAMATIANLIFKIDAGENVSQDAIAQAAVIASAAIAEFRATVRTESVMFPAELFVDGNDDGFIDFGANADYSRFGDDGNQEFTVELWVKFKTMPGGIGAVVSTFIENGGVRCGWMVNMINGDYFRMTYTQNVEHGLWEPGDGFSDPNRWVHVAAVYKDGGVDGENGVIAKYYENGVLKNTINNNDPGRYYNPADDNRFQLLPMIAFAQHTSDGSLTRKSQGYIKHFHIWKTAKSENEIKNLMDGTTAVTGQEPDLVCGWKFDYTVEDDTNIMDLTGKYTATVRGKHEWQLLLP